MIAFLLGVKLLNVGSHHPYANPPEPRSHTALARRLMEDLGVMAERRHFLAFVPKMGRGAYR
jgi:hypothetical protein